MIVGALLMLSVGGLCPGLQMSNNPGLFRIVSGCFGLPLGNFSNFTGEEWVISI